MAVDGGIEAVASARRRFLDAPTVDEAIDSMMAELQGAFALWYGSLAVYLSRAEAMIVHAWTPVATPLANGTRVSTGATDEVQARSDVVYRGRTTVVDPAAIDLGLLGDVLSVGERTTIVAVPVIDGSPPSVGMVGFVSAAPDGLDEEDVHLLEALVAGITDPLVARCGEARAVATQ